MTKIRSEKLAVGDVIKHKCFRHGSWSRDGHYVRVGSCFKGKAAGNPARAKFWYVVEEIVSKEGYVEVTLQTLTDRGSRNPDGEYLLLEIHDGGPITFKYWGRMNEAGTEIVYTIPPAGTI